MRQHNEQLREQIINVAQAAFSARGFAAVSIRELAAELQISKGNIYNYFTGKEDLFAACIGDTAAAFSTTLTAMEAKYTQAQVAQTTDPDYFSNIEQELLTVFKHNGVAIDLLLNCSNGSALAGGAVRLTLLTKRVTAAILRLNNAYPGQPKLAAAFAETFASSLINSLQTIIRHQYPTAIHATTLDTCITLFSNGLKQTIRSNS